MEQELQELIGSPEFRLYHKALQARPFNLFDVLRNAEYEIRHSNVLAWLLDPGQNHRIGDAFLREFVRYLHEQADNANIARMPEPSSYEARKIGIERELDYVDVTIFFEEPPKLLIAIENKTEETSPAYVEQARHYDKKLREKYKDEYRIQSVLLTTSRDGSHSESGLIHVSWFRIREIVSSILDTGKFGSGATPVFVRQYLEIVKRMLPGDEQGAVDPVDALVARHSDLLTRLVEELEDGPRKMRRELDTQHPEYGNTVDTLVNHFWQKPMELRAEVNRHLQGKGFETTHGGRLKGPRKGPLFLTFSNASIDEINRRLNTEGPLSWSMDFTHQEVNLGFYFPWKTRLSENRPVLDAIEKFIRENPIDRRHPDKYPMTGKQWLCVYRNPLFTSAELARTPASRIKAEALARMDRFVGEDCATIEGYLRCLAFDPRSAGG